MYVNERVSYNGELCTVRYVGSVEGTKGEWIGVEWDDPTRGKHNGEAGGKRYFTCASKEPKAASFIRPNRPADEPRDFITALRFKYASEHIRISFQIGGPSQDKAIRISGKEVEEVGFDKIRSQLADLRELRIVLLDGLCIRQPLSETLLTAWCDAPPSPRIRVLSNIHKICPKIIELDLSRNLFESFKEVAAICEQLENLKSLRLDGNRFGQITLSETEKAHMRIIFAKVESLTLENTLLKWCEVVDICSLFLGLKTLSVSSNELESLDYEVPLEHFPSINTMKMESNDFHSLADMATLHKLESLKKLDLKLNSISAISQRESTRSLVFPTLTDLDLSYNAISSWAPIDALPSTLPQLTSLRISHNPLYMNLHNPAGRELTSEDGYMLTIGRLPRLKLLNFSSISDKDRLNAESYYMSLIALELSLAPESDMEKIQANHSRWRELCEEYGEPEIKREKEHVDPRSLAARLLSIEFVLSEPAARVFNKPSGMKVLVPSVPKRFNIYSVLGVMARAFEQAYVVPGLSLSLVTEDWEEVNGERMRREVKLVPETRGIGTFIEQRSGKVMVDYEMPPNDVEEYEHPIKLAQLMKPTTSLIPTPDNGKTGDEVS